MTTYTAIAAVSLTGGIGYNGTLPWQVPEDLKHFKEVTENSIVIMGRKTWDSLPAPLPNRINIVLSKSHYVDIPETADTSTTLVLNSVEAVNDWVNAYQKKHNKVAAYIIGGSEIYKAFAAKTDKVIISTIPTISPVDTYFPYEEVFREGSWDITEVENIKSSKCKEFTVYTFTKS